MQLRWHFLVKVEEGFTEIDKEGSQHLFELFLHCNNHSLGIGLFVLVIVVEAS